MWHKSFKNENGWKKSFWTPISLKHLRWTSLPGVFYRSILEVKNDKVLTISNKHFAENHSACPRSRTSIVKYFFEHLAALGRFQDNIIKNCLYSHGDETLEIFSHFEINKNNFPEQKIWLCYLGDRTYWERCTYILFSFLICKNRCNTWTHKISMIKCIIYCAFYRLHTFIFALLSKYCALVLTFLN